MVGARYGVVVICSCDSGISGDDTDWRLGQTPAAWNAWVTLARLLLRRTRMSESLEPRQPHGIDGAHLVTAPGFSPVRMIEVELTQPLPALLPDGECQRAWVLARLHTEPVGV